MHSPDVRDRCGWSVAKEAAAPTHGITSYSSRSVIFWGVTSMEVQRTMNCVIMYTLTE